MSGERYPSGHCSFFVLQNSALTGTARQEQTHAAHQ